MALHRILILHGTAQSALATQNRTIRLRGAAGVACRSFVSFELTNPINVDVLHRNLAVNRALHRILILHSPAQSALATQNRTITLREAAGVTYRSFVSLELTNPINVDVCIGI